MLDPEDDAALAEIEAALRRDDPAFVLLIERLEHDPLGVPSPTRSTDSHTAAIEVDPAEGATPGRTREPSGPSGAQFSSPRFERRFDDRPDPLGRAGSGPAFRRVSHPLVPPTTPGARTERSRSARLRQWLLLIAAIFTAMALTVVVTTLAGPDLGGLTGVISLTGVTFLGYRRMTGCPWRSGQQR
ncbi:MAG: hypothetical protein ACKV2O_09000 [Acidimicrobiales bacterium]